MPTFKAELLMRDKRLDWLQKQGVEVNFTKLGEEDIADALRQKLLEEATEAAVEENPQELLKELADVMEVLYALADKCGITRDELAEKVSQRKEELGGLEEGYYSHSVTMPDGHPAELYYRENVLKYPEVKE